MKEKNKRWYLYGFLSLTISTLAIFGGVLIHSRNASGVIGDTKQTVGQSVLGETSSQTHFGKLTVPVPVPLVTRSSVLPTVVPSPIVFKPTVAAPLLVDYSVALVYGPTELTEGDSGTFTWAIGGPPRTIHTTTLYYGSNSSPGTLAFSAKPEDTHYTNKLLDFIQGDYGIPLQFVGNTNFNSPGTYFYRAYVLIDGKHYWSGERSFVVKPIPKHEIKIINYPSSLYVGANATFTWEIYGPTGTTGFTAIVGGKQSKPGALSSTVDLPQTPYTILVNDFISGNYEVPLRFIGNVAMTDPGIYYFRALTFINGQNIWSDEYTLTVQ